MLVTKKGNIDLGQSGKGLKSRHQGMSIPSVKVRQVLDYPGVGVVKYKNCLGLAKLDVPAQQSSTIQDLVFGPSCDLQPINR
jgi:hypothetical protein